MADKVTLQLANFRSVRDPSIDIAPLTVVYGPNGTGKSSLIYGLLTLNNFLTTPTQAISGLFSYPGISLGGFREVVFNHRERSSVSLSLEVSTADRQTSMFRLVIRDSDGISQVRSTHPDASDEFFGLGVDIAFPYRGNIADSETMIFHDGERQFDENLVWNGLYLSTMLSGASYQRPVADFFEASQLPHGAGERYALCPTSSRFHQPHLQRGVGDTISLNRGRGGLPTCQGRKPSVRSLRVYGRYRQPPSESASSVRHNDFFD